jgi:hypothetical protein
MRCARALPIQLMPAAGSRKLPVATALSGGLPGKNERPHPSPARRAPHPSSCRRTLSVDPDKAGRRHAPREHLAVHGRQQMT